MTHDIKVEQFVQRTKEDGYTHEVGRVKEISESGTWVTLDMGGGKGLEAKTFRWEPLTLRNGDFVKTEGMTQEQFDRIRSNNNISSSNWFSNETWAFLRFYNEEWEGVVGPKTEDRLLTPEQILSTLPEEEDVGEILTQKASSISGLNVVDGVITTESAQEGGQGLFYAPEDEEQPDKFPTNPHEEANGFLEGQAFSFVTAADNAGHKSLEINARPKVQEIDWTMTQTLEYMIDVMTRAKAGEEVQQQPSDEDSFRACRGAVWDWHNNNYRIKPREPRVIYLEEDVEGGMARVLHHDSPDNLNKPIKFVEVMDDE